MYFVSNMFGLVTHDVIKPGWDKIITNGDSIGALLQQDHLIILSQLESINFYGNQQRKTLAYNCTTGKTQIMQD